MKNPFVKEPPEEEFTPDPEFVKACKEVDAGVRAFMKEKFPNTSGNVQVEALLGLAIASLVTAKAPLDAVIKVVTIMYKQNKQAQAVEALGRKK